mmetsp:Transcript_60158/g.175793  ORF Transcript_60158/g.175793 Transcript_60158/m.175793 type:complete len:590 (+) Transcript_60158:72-1841(+)
MERPGSVALCTEFISVLDTMLEKHHNRLLQSLQTRNPADHCLPTAEAWSTDNCPRSAQVSAWRTSWPSPPHAHVRWQEGCEAAPPDADERLGIFSNGLLEMGHAGLEGPRGSRDEKSRGEEDSPRSGEDVPAEVEGETILASRSHSTVTFTSESPENKARTSSYTEYLQLARTQSLHRGTFAGRIRRTALRPTINRGETYPGLCPALTDFVASSRFELLMSIFILGNALFCGVEVEYMAQTKAKEPPQTLDHVSLLFTIGFAVELCLRIVGEGRKFLQSPNCKWNVFDCFIVVTGLLEKFLGGLQVSSLRIIRMARIIRVMRIARVMRHFRSLRILIYAVSSTIRSLFWMMSILMIALYSFGLLFTQAVTQHQVFPDGLVIPGLEDAFGTLGRSMFTLFKAISGGVDWQEPVALLGRLHPVWVAIYLIYFMLTYFALLNVVTGVFCHTAIESASHDQDMAAQAQMVAKEEYILMLRRLFKRINMNHTGTITLQELECALKDDKVSSYFEAIDLSSDEAFSLFKLLDEDGSHVLDIDAFVTGCLKLRGQAKNVQIAMMMHETRWKMQKLMKSVRCIEEQMHELTKACPPR